MKESDARVGEGQPQACPPTGSTAAGNEEAIRCSVCDNEVPDNGDLVCVDCYDASRHELPNPVRVELSRDDCYALLGHLMGQRAGWLRALQVRFFEALELAAKKTAVDPVGELAKPDPSTRDEKP